MKTNTEAVLVAGEGVCLEGNISRTTYMFISREHNTGRNYKIKTDNIHFENGTKFKYSGTTTNKSNYMPRESTGTACYR
jgi:hypothetical protein